VGASFHHGLRCRRPPCAPGPGDYPRPVLPLASQRAPSHTARSFRAAAHPPLHAMVDFPGRSLVPRPTMAEDSWNGPGPSAPWPEQGVTSCVLVSRTRSVGVTPLAWLLRTQAPVRNPPAVAVVPAHRWSRPVAVSPCWEEDVPDGVLPILPGVLGPRPRRLVEGRDPWLPPRQRPAPRADRVGAPHPPSSDCRTAPVSRLQSCTHVQARRGAHPPGRSSRYGHVRMAAVVAPSALLVGRSLPTPRIGLPSAAGHGRQRTCTS
jgi:hypothetical protein